MANHVYWVCQVCLWVLNNQNWLAQLNTAPWSEQLPAVETQAKLVKLVDQVIFYHLYYLTKLVNKMFQMGVMVVQRVALLP